MRYLVMVRHGQARSQMYRLSVLLSPLLPNGEVDIVLMYGNKPHVADSARALGRNLGPALLHIRGYDLLAAEEISELDVLEILSSVERSGKDNDLVVLVTCEEQSWKVPNVFAASRGQKIGFPALDYGEAAVISCADGIFGYFRITSETRYEDVLEFASRETARS